MNYRSQLNKKTKWRRVGERALTGAIVVALFVIFVFAVKWFRAPKVEKTNEVDSIVDVLTPTPISDSVIAGAIDTVSREATLLNPSNGADLGMAKRGIKDDNYYLQLKTQLPEIDREVYYYNVWLLRQVPYSYFSAGEMVTDEEARFVFEWNGEDEKSYQDFTHLIVTLQEYGGSVDPQKHILEGEFGK